jgi:GntR family transcriptional regulator
MAAQDKIRKDIPLALYYQLKEELKRKILSNEWEEGRKLPSENEICAIFGVSRITVRKAFEELEDENYIIKRQGRGTFVQSRTIGQKLHKFYTFREELCKLGIKETTKLVTFQAIIPGSAVRDALKLDVDEKVFRIKRIRYMDALAYTIEQSYIPQKIVPDLTGEMVQNNGLYNH